MKTTLKSFKYLLKANHLNYKLNSNHLKPIFQVPKHHYPKFKSYQSHNPYLKTNQNIFPCIPDVFPTLILVQHLHYECILNRYIKYSDKKYSTRQKSSLWRFMDFQACGTQSYFIQFNFAEKMGNEQTSGTQNKKESPQLKLWKQIRQEQIEKTFSEKRQSFKREKMLAEQARVKAQQDHKIDWKKQFSKPLFPGKQYYQEQGYQNYYQNLSNLPNSQINFNQFNFQCQPLQNPEKQHHQVYKNYHPQPVNNFDDNKNAFQNPFFPTHENSPFHQQKPQKPQKKKQFFMYDPLKNNYGPQKKLKIPKLRENIKQEPLPYNLLTKYQNYVVFKEVLGSGTFSKVYLGKDQTTQTKVAVKQVSQLEENEIKCLSSINSPYVIGLKKFWKDASTQKTYLVLDLCKNNLRQELAKCDKITAMKYFDDVIKGMKALVQKNIVHRDLKFENILISFQGIAKITDFGLAKEFGNLSNVASVRCGTPYTMAPEILFHSKKSKVTYTNKCDVWSIGVLLHEILYGVHPFDQNMERVSLMHRVKVQKRFGYYDYLIDRSLVKNPEKRMGWPEFMHYYGLTNLQDFHLFLKVPQKIYQILPKKMEEKKKNNLFEGVVQKIKAPKVLQKRVYKISDFYPQINLNNKQDQQLEEPKFQFRQKETEDLKFKQAKGKKKNQITFFKEEQQRRKALHRQKKQKKELRQIKAPYEVIELENNGFKTPEKQVEKVGQVHCSHRKDHFGEKLTFSFLFFAIMFLIANIYDL